MIPSGLGAYQAASYAFTQRADSGNEIAKVNAAQEKPEFKASLNGLQTRTGADEARETNKRSANDSKNTGRGRFVDVLA
jgi:hypothetical protein